jgi:hypothetical protein
LPTKLPTDHHNNLDGNGNGIWQQRKSSSATLHQFIHNF